MEYKIGFVYKITNPNGRIYVGSTINLKRRISQYKNNYFKNQIKIHRSIEKYGWTNHIFEILWEGDVKDMLKKEAELGTKLNALSENNLNLMLPKGDSKFSCISEETRLKMSNSAKGRIISEYCKKRIREVHIGKIVSIETRKKMSEWQIGRKMSDEAKLNMSLAAKGKIVSIETRNKISNFRSKPILQYDLEGNFIQEWKSATYAGKELQINASHISTCCKGKRKTAGKFKWNFKKNK